MTKEQKKLIAYLKRFGWNFNCKDDERDVLRCQPRGTTKKTYDKWSKRIQKMWGVDRIDVHPGCLMLAHQASVGGGIRILAKTAIVWKIKADKLDILINEMHRMNLR